MQATIQELRIYVKGIWRRRWLGLLAAWAISLIGVFYVFSMPNQFRSSAQIYVDTDSLLRPLLRGIAVEANVDEQLRVMQQTLLSRPNLAKVARANDMDLSAATPAEMDEMLKRISTQTSLRYDGRGLFTVSYTDTNPSLTKDIVQSLLTIYMESNLNANRSDMQQARSFIEQEIAAYEARLVESERRMAKFRAENAEVVGATNYSGQIQNARSQIVASTQALADAEGKRDQLRERLASTSRFTTLDGASQMIVNGQPVQSTLSRISALQTELDALLLQYTENHPDVIGARRQIELLSSQYERERTGQSSSGQSKIPNPLFNEIELMLVQAETEVSQAERRLQQANSNMDRLKEYSTIAPAVDAELADITREYNIVRGKYEELLSTRETARISEAVDTDTESVEFRIIEPPEIPATPYGPNRPNFLAFVLFVAVGAGTGAAFLRSQLDNTFMAPEQLEKALKLPVLGAVTRVTNAQESARSALATAGFFMASGSLFAFFVGIYLVIWLLPPSTNGSGLISFSGLI